MNYRDFGEDKKINGKKIQAMIDASRPTNLSEIASKWNFFSNDVLVGLVCTEARFCEWENRLAYLITSNVGWGDIIAPVNRSLIKRKASGLYLIEGVKTGYSLDVLDANIKKAEVIGKYGCRVPVSQLVLPTDKFMPLYVN